MGKSSVSDPDPQWQIASKNFFSNVSFNILRNFKILKRKKYISQGKYEFALA
jgi:hypothetical protein